MTKNIKNEYITVKSSSIHNNGVFAKKNIPAGTKIIEYVGEKITKKEAERRFNETFKKAQNSEEHGAVYLFHLNSRYDIDGNVPYNPARFINHSCKPNCEVKIIKGHIWVIALANIKNSEELSYNYSYDYEVHEDHPCLCGTDICVGYIVAEEHWPKLKRKLARKKHQNRP
ncbi:MAG: SET domain-containing protein-lysine N-methyltransferase [Candidatus Omnitrophica bacterium]|nr:SET domain-containing protein-lysine N-methyltransferase [Candidatus Omnitrophota bacterium]